MPPGLLETLAERGVPPVPEELNERVHQRLNRALVVGQLIDLAVGGLPFVAVRFFRAIVHFIESTFTGRFESDRGDRTREAP